MGKPRKTISVAYRCSLCGEDHHVTVVPGCILEATAGDELIHVKGNAEIIRDCDDGRTGNEG